MSEGTLAATVRELRPAAEPRSLVEHSLVQLTLVRFREFLREPEAVFWVFVFPMLLAAGLGIAFRNRPADVVKIGAVGVPLGAALLGMNLMGSGSGGLGFAIVDARRKKLLKRLVASPMPRSQYLLSFLLSRLVLLYVEVGAVVGFGVLVFGVPVRGPIWELAVIALLASLSFSALGLLIASRVKTIEAASGLMNFVMLPMWIFSGVFFSSERFPTVFQPFIKALPLTAVIDALRASMLQGVRLSHLGLELAVMTGWLIVC